MRMAESARADGTNLENAQRAMRALANAMDAGRLPIELAGVTTKKEICERMRYKMELGHSGAYVQTTEYSDESPTARALQALADANGSGAQRVEENRREMERASVLNQKIPGFFPTPRMIADQMIQAMDLDETNPLQRILEPSAGRGDLADAVAEKIGPGAVECCEINPTLRGIVAERYATFGECDFMQLRCFPQYDGVVMNPPFEKRQDAQHICHAFGFLRPGGVLVSLCSPMLLKGSDSKAQDFQAWFDDQGGEIIAEGLDGFENTGARATMIRLHKPEPSPIVTSAVHTLAV